MGRSAWATRCWGGGRAADRVLALWTLLLHAGVSVYRPDVIVLGAVALVPAAGAALPAVRARIKAARRGRHTTFGAVDGTVRVP